MAKVGVKYAGLHKRDSYEGLIDYLDNKQEKLKLPNRDAKFIRDSPQYQSLLNEGFLEVEEQQLNQIKQEQQEHAVIRTANDTNETAKEVKVVASQTDKPLIIHTQSKGTQSQVKATATGTQSQVETTATGTQSQVEKTTSGSQTLEIFDMTVNDKMAKVKQDIGSVEDTEQQHKSKKAERISDTIQKNLGEDDLSRHTTLGFAQRIAASGASGLKQVGSMFQQSSSSSKHLEEYIGTVTKSSC